MWWNFLFSVWACYLVHERILAYVVSLALKYYLDYDISFQWIALRIGMLGSSEPLELVIRGFTWHNPTRGVTDELSTEAFQHKASTRTRFSVYKGPCILGAREVRLRVSLTSLIEFFKWGAPIGVSEACIDGLRVWMERTTKDGKLNLFEALHMDETAAESTKTAVANTFTSSAKLYESGEHPDEAGDSARRTDGGMVLHDDTHLMDHLNSHHDDHDHFGRLADARGAGEGQGQGRRRHRTGHGLGGRMRGVLSSMGNVVAEANASVAHALSASKDPGASPAAVERSRSSNDEDAGAEPFELLFRVRRFVLVDSRAYVNDFLVKPHSKSHNIKQQKPFHFHAISATAGDFRAVARKHARGDAVTLGEIVGVLVRKIVVDVMSNNKLSILTTAFDTAKDGLKNSVRSATHEVRSMTSHGFANITNTIVPTRSLSLRGMVQEISTELLEAFPGGAKLLIRLEGHDFPRITPKARFRLRHKAIKDLPPGTERSRVMVTTATLGISKDPVWPEEYALEPITSFDDELNVTVFEFRVLRTDQKIGKVTMALREMGLGVDAASGEVNLPLRDDDGAITQGVLSLKARLVSM